MRVKTSSKYLYLYSLCIFLVAQVLFTGVYWNGALQGVFNSTAQLLLRVAWVLLVIALIKNKTVRNRKTLLWLTAILIFYVSYRVAHDNTLFYGMLFAILAGVFELDFGDIIKTYYYTLVFCVIVLILASISGLAQDRLYTFTYGIGHTVGMAHPNNIAALLMNIVFLSVYLFLRKRIVFASLIVAICAYVTYRLTVSRTVLVAMLALAVFLLLLKCMRLVKSDKLFNVLRISVFLLFALSFYFAFAYEQMSNSLMNDTNFWVRFNQGYRIYKQYGIHLLGNNIEFVKVAESTMQKKAVILDNGYLNLLLHFGILPSLIYAVFVARFMKKLTENKEYVLLGISALFLICGFMEKSIYTIQYCFIMLGMFTSIYKERGNEE